MIGVPDLQTINNIEKQDVDFWQMFHAVTVAIQKVAHSQTAVYQAYSEQIKRLGLYSSISWVDETETFLEVASIVPPRGVEFLLAKRPMIGARFPLNKIPVTRSVIENGRAIYEADIVSLLFDGRLNPLIKLWPAAPRFLPHIPVIIAPLYRDGRIQGVLYLAGKTISPGDLDAVTALAHHLSIALDNARLFRALQTDIAERQQSELVQSILYRIAAIANTDITINELFASIHHILGDLIDVSNFYIAAYDPESNSISFPYFVDEKDKKATKRPAGNGLTEYVAQTNTPQLLTAENIKELENKSIICVRGTVPLIWLGVPLTLSSGTIGVIAVQSYTDIHAYTEKDKQLLQFVSGQIATAVHRKQTEVQLQALTDELQQQAQMRDAILATSPDHFSVMDRNGRFLFANPLQNDSINWDYKNAVGKTWQEIGIPPLIGNHFDQDREKALKTGQSISRELELPGLDGPAYIEYVISPVKQTNGSIPYVVITARNITERKKAAEAMYHTQKMESLGILAGGIAHDFNNLLVAMLAQTSLALAKLGPSAPAAPHIQKAIGAAESATALTQQLLAYSGRGQFHTAPVNLNRLIQENSHLIHITLGQNVKLQLPLAADLPAIEADAGQMQQIIMNLIINAAEAIGKQHGVITVTTQAITLSPEKLEEWPDIGQQLTPGPYAKLTVEDDGMGMDEHTIKQIFDPFYTTKFTGRGLGLAAVLGIVRGHKGALRVESQPHQGTKFEIIFPASNKPIQEKPPMNATAHPNPRKIVLVIDDEEPVREAVSDILGMEGVDVLQAADGQTGIGVYQAHMAEIDLVLLDLSMPGLSGEDTLKELHQIDPQVRILLSSGYSESEVTYGLEQSGLVGFLQKPYRMDTLLEEVSRHLNHT